MKLNVKILRGESPAGLAEAIERRVRFSLGRFGDRIERTDVTLDDVNGPRGGPDQCCTLRVTIAALPPVVVELTDVEALAAVGRAADRAARRVSEALNRRRDLRRGATPT